MSRWYILKYSIPRRVPGILGSATGRVGYPVPKIGSLCLGEEDGRRQFFSLILGRIAVRRCRLFCCRRIASVGLSVDREPYTQTVERMSFAKLTRVRPMKRVLDGTAHWRHLANTIEPSMCRGHAVLCQITLTLTFPDAIIFFSFLRMRCKVPLRCLNIDVLP